jgi:hypothetical protein
MRKAARIQSGRFANVLAGTTLARVREHLDRIKILGVSDSTNRAYNSGYNSFLRFSDRFPEIQNFSRDEQLLSFVSALSMAKLAPATIILYVQGVKSNWRMLELPFSQDNFILSRILKGVRRENLIRAKVRLPITIQILDRLLLINKFVTKSEYEVTLLASMFLTAFHSLLRVGEIVDAPHTIQIDQVQIFAHRVNTSAELFQAEKFAIIQFRTTKTDQFGLEGQWTWMHQDANLRHCPINALLKYWEIRPCVQVKNLFVDQKGNPITKQYFRDRLNAMLGLAGVPVDQYGTHSFRIGGAAHLFYSGWTIEQVQKRGRWKSPEMTSHYCFQNKLF